MKSEKAKEYLASICKASAMFYEGEQEECDLKLKDAKHAVELAENDMIEKAVKAFCYEKCHGMCVSFEFFGCKDKDDFKKKLIE